MKLSKKIIYTIVCAAGFGMLCSVAVLASSTATEEEYDEDTYGPKELMVWQTPVPRVTFSHKVHTMDAELECDSCHDDLFEMEAGAVLSKDDFTMSSFLKGNYCGACHDGDTAFNANSDEMCVACHTAPNKIIFTKPVKAVIFDHKLHVDDMGLNCTNCHSEVFKMMIGDAEKNEQEFTMESLYKGKYCGACHDGEQAFASSTLCTTCHIGVMGFNRLVGGGSAKKKGGH